MRKLIAISVVFALVLGAAFAQPNIGGNFKVGTSLLNGETVNEVDRNKDSGNGRPRAGGTFFDAAHIDAKFGDADAGGLIRFYHSPGNPSYNIPGHQPIFAYAWWRPMEFLRLQMGQFADGDWGGADIAGWGFDAEAKAVGAAMSMYGEIPGAANVATDSGNNAWAPGFGALGMTLQLTPPIEGLQFNIGVPIHPQGKWQDIYGRLYLDLTYALADLGTLKVAAKLSPGSHARYVPNKAEEDGSTEPNYHWRGNAEEHDPLSFWAAFYLKAIENVAVDIGVGFKLPYTTHDAKFQSGVVIGDDGTLDISMVNVGGIGVGTLPVNTKVRSPIDVGLGVNFNADALGVKARAGVSFGGSKEVNKSKNDAYKSTKETYEIIGFGTGHIPAKLYLDSATFYQKYTATYTTTLDGKDVPLSYDYYVARKGTQVKQADPVTWGVNVKPTYKIKDITVHVNLGVGMKHYRKQEVTVEKLWSDGRSYSVGLKDFAAKNKIDIDVDDLPASFFEEKVTFEGNPQLFSKERNIDVPTNVDVRIAPYQTALAKATAGGDADKIARAGKELATATIAAEAAYYADITKITKNMKTVNFDVDWFVNPYLQIPAGGGQFYIGVKLYNGGKIPVKYNYSAANAQNAVADSADGKVLGNIPGGSVGHFANYTDTSKPLASYANVLSTRSSVKWSIPIGFNFYF